MRLKQRVGSAVFLSQKLQVVAGICEADAG